MSQAVIVVPCYNEASRLDARAFQQFAREDRRPRFLFVDDGSTDGTSEVLDGLRRSDPERFAVESLGVNVGKAEAVRRGLLRAFESAPEYVGYWDADLATPLDAIPTFCAVLDSRPDIDVVFGARVSLLGRSVRRDPLRHYLGRVFATAASLALGVGFYDTQCGAKLFRASSEIQTLFRSPFVSRWIFDVEIVARLAASRWGTGRAGVDEVVYEFPLHEWRDVAGSKVRPGDFVRALLELALIARRYPGQPARVSGPRSPKATIRFHTSPTAPPSASLNRR
jgi:glycosyltransferase involved in cell wall biosynthesis